MAVTAYTPEMLNTHIAVGYVPARSMMVWEHIEQVRPASRHP